MNTQTLILAILNFQDATGYEIKKLSSEGEYSYFVDISYGSIYPTLSRLETDGLVTSEAHSQQGKPDKRIYSITDMGRNRFLETIFSNPPRKDKIKSEFLLVAMCASLCDRKTIERALEGHVDENKQILSQIKDVDTDYDEASVKWITRYGEHVTKAKLEFLEQHGEELLAIAGMSSTRPQAAE